jgi:hypothetical protein
MLHTILRRISFVQFGLGEQLRRVGKSVLVECQVVNPESKLSKLTVESSQIGFGRQESRALEASGLQPPRQNFFWE